MTDPIRLLHFADIHIGMENYGKTDPSTGISTRVMDFLERMNEVVQYAHEYEADLVIFAGDAFKTRTPNPTFQREFARRIKRMAQYCPVVLLVGNHDIPTMLEKASSVEIFHTLEVENVVVGRTPRLHWVETRRGPVQIATVPYPVRQRLLADVSTRGLGIDHIDEMLREKLDQLIRALAEEVDPDVPAILTGHFSIQGATYGSERGVMLGRDVTVLPSTVTDPVWDYVAMGHIHCYQDVNQGNHPPVVYSGSLERIDFGEEHDPKGFCWVELERGASRYEFIESPARPFVTLRVDARAVADPTATVIKEIKRKNVEGAIIRVIVTTTPETDPLLRDREIEAELEKASYVAAIKHEVEHPVRSRLGVERIEGLAPLDMLERYLIYKETPPERISVLKQAAEEIMSRWSEEIDPWPAS